MSLPLDNCIAWWKLEDATAEIGNNFTVTPTITYAVCKFNNGAQNAATGYMTVANALTSSSKFIFEACVKTPWSLTNGKASSGTNTLFSWRYDANNRMYLYILSSGNYGGVLDIFGSGVYVQYYNPSGWDWLANSLNHIIIVIDKDGIDGGANTVRMYLNGTMIYSSSVALPTIVASTGNFRLFTIDTIANPWIGIIDNVKLYNDTSQALITAIIANKDNEGWPSAGKKIRNKFNRIEGRFNI